MNVITPADLTSYLRDDSLATNTSLEQIVDLTNDLIAEEWSTPVDPAPVKIRLLALNVAARAWANDPSRSNLDSITRSVDDATRTERYRTSNQNGSVYLTETEEALLNGRARRRSVRLTIYGES